MKNKSKLFVLSVIALFVMQVLTILISWIVGAVWPSLGIRSLLSGSGLRWLLGSLTYNLADNLLIWLLVLSISFGAFWWSELPKKIISYSQNDYQSRFAINVFFCVVLLGLMLNFLLALFPGSSLLGVSGHLIPGPFVNAASLVMCMAVFGGSVVFMILVGKVKDSESAEKACTFGLKMSAPLIVIYLLLKELVEMVLFVL